MLLAAPPVVFAAVVLSTRSQPTGVPIGQPNEANNADSINETALAVANFRTKPVLPCLWDCGNGDLTVDIVDFLTLLFQWGGPGTCDFDGGGVGITDFLTLLGAWGPCT